MHYNSQYILIILFNINYISLVIHLHIENQDFQKLKIWINLNHRTLHTSLN